MTELAQPALKAVMEDEIRLVPAKFKNTYRYWMENVKDWCISRQLWWGQQIPAYFLPKGGYVVAETPEEALKLAREKTGDASLTATDLRRDPDVLDTWFSSWLWPISVFDGINRPENEEIKYYYPTNDLVTGPDILFFWVARMIIAGYEYRGEMPFRNVYLTGIVRDKLRRKMSKSLGNSPDPLDLIEQYGADGVRLAMLLCSAAGNDLLFDDALCEQGRNFGNKIWNAYRLVNGWQVDDSLAQSDSDRLAVSWFDAMLNRTLGQIEEDFTEYRISEALMKLYRLFWDEFSGWYLEMVKPGYRQPTDRATMDATKAFFDRLLRTLHPFMPFITEEIWQALPHEGDFLIKAKWPEYRDELSFPQEEEAMGLIIDAITAIRARRNEMNVAPSKKVHYTIATAHADTFARGIPFFKRLASASDVTVADANIPTPDGSIEVVTHAARVLMPLAELVDFEKELARIAKEKANAEKQLAGIENKLSNQGFIAKAPEAVVNGAREDAAKLRALIEKLDASAAAMKK